MTTEAAGSPGDAVASGPRRRLALPLRVLASAPRRGGTSAPALAFAPGRLRPPESVAGGGGAVGVTASGSVNVQGLPELGSLPPSARRFPGAAAGVAVVAGTVAGVFDGMVAGGRRLLSTGNDATSMVLSSRSSSSPYPRLRRARLAWPWSTRGGGGGARIRGPVKTARQVRTHDALGSENRTWLYAILVADGGLGGIARNSIHSPRSRPRTSPCRRRVATPDRTHTAPSLRRLHLSPPGGGGAQNRIQVKCRRDAGARVVTPVY